jgi:hypothetical protein
MNANFVKSHPALAGHSSRYLARVFAGVHHVRSILMKKTSRSHSPRESSHRDATACQTKGGWAFNLASERLFAFGSIESGKRGAYLTAQGEMRFLPL